MWDEYQTHLLGRVRPMPSLITEETREPALAFKAMCQTLEAFTDADVKDRIAPKWPRSSNALL